MFHPEACGEKLILRFHHVAVTVAGKSCVPAVARFARISVSDVIGQDDEKFRGIEGLADPEKFAGELRPNELCAAAGGPMHDEDDVLSYPFRIFHGLTERPVVEPQLRHGFTGGKLEVVRDKIAFFGRRILRRPCSDEEKSRREAEPGVSRNPLPKGSKSAPSWHLKRGCSSSPSALDGMRDAPGAVADRGIVLSKFAMKKYWLVKQEPEAYSWNDFVRDGLTKWTGVRNFQARNNLRAMRQGDAVLFYHSVSDKAVVGLAEVTREAYPDPTAKEGDWSAVDLKPVKALPRPVTLEEIKAETKLREIALLRNSRLSVQPLGKREFELICRL